MAKSKLGDKPSPIQRNAVVARNIVVGASVVIGAIIFLVGQSVALYRDTHYAKTQQDYKKLQELSVDERLEYFTSVLGEPTYQDRSGILTEYTYVAPNYFVQAVTNQNKVVMYSVTIRSANFHPRLAIPGHSIHQRKTMFITLGKTTFAQAQRVMGVDPWGVQGATGLHDYGYSEIYYLGNPNNYKDTVFTNNEAAIGTSQAFNQGYSAVFNMLSPYNGNVKFIDSFLLGPSSFNVAQSNQNSQIVTKYLSDGAIRAGRDSLVINTYSETSPTDNELAGIEKLPLVTPFGPNYDEVRNLPGYFSPGN